jgi:glycosyltransferase involved in cell wall biosynthesis
MRIAMVAEPAGHVTGLSAALAARGHEVTLYCREPGAPGRGFRVVRVPAEPPGDVPGNQPELSRTLHSAWSRNRPDVVHTQTWITAPAALGVAVGMGIPVVHTVRGAGALTGRRAEVERVLTRAAARVTVTCTAHADALIARGVGRPAISVVPDGVDSSVFQPEGHRARRGTAHRLVTLGDRTPHAGLSTAVAALCGLPKAELVIAGDADDAAAGLRGYADRLGVADRVHWSAQALPSLLRSADVAVCTPWHEPWEGTALEAIACGTAVVATRVGPLSDTIVDGVTGLLVPPRRPRELARAVHRLLTRPTVREQYGAAGVDRVAARFTWDRIATEALSVYTRVGAPTPGATPSERRGQPIGAWH